MKKTILLFALTIILFGSGYTQVTKFHYYTKTFISDPVNEGYITNSTPRMLLPYYSGGQGKEIIMGWNAEGFAMRGFISFDFSTIKPKAGEVLVIDKATLKVFEANTNMHPFNGDGVRTVQCYLIDYQDLDINDYDLQPLDSCGTIAMTGYSVLTEHPLVVTAKMVSMMAKNSAASTIQFRLQFFPDENLLEGSQLKQSMWNIFSGAETQKAAYRPQLQVKYHFIKKGLSVIKKVAPVKVQ
jgi:hypothetical protein